MTNIVGPLVMGLTVLLVVGAGIVFLLGRGSKQTGDGQKASVCNGFRAWYAGGDSQYHVFANAVRAGVPDDEFGRAAAFMISHSTDQTTMSYAAFVLGHACGVTSQAPERPANVSLPPAADSLALAAAGTTTSPVAASSAPAPPATTVTTATTGSGTPNDVTTTAVPLAHAPSEDPISAEMLGEYAQQAVTFNDGSFVVSGVTRSDAYVIEGFRNDGTSSWLVPIPNGTGLLSASPDGKGFATIVTTDNGGLALRQFSKDGTDGRTIDLGTTSSFPEGFAVSTDSVYIVDARIGEVSEASKLIRYAPDGKVLWSVELQPKSAGGVAIAHGIALAPDGGVVVTGTIRHTESSEFDSFVARYDANGTLTWMVNPVVPGDQHAFAARVVADGTVYVVGSTSADSGSTAHDAYVERITSTGASVWRTTVHEDTLTDLRSIAVTDAGGVMIGGAAGGFPLSCVLDGYTFDGKQAWRGTIRAPGNCTINAAAEFASGDMVIVGQRVGVGAMVIRLRF